MRFQPPHGNYERACKRTCGVGLWGIQRWTRWWWTACKCPLHHLSRHSCPSAASSASIRLSRDSLMASCCSRKKAAPPWSRRSLSRSAVSGRACRTRASVSLQRRSADSLFLVSPLCFPPVFPVDYDDNGSKRVFSPREETMTHKMIKKKKKKTGTEKRVQSQTSWNGSGV